MLALSLLLPSALAAIADDLMKTLPGAPVPLNFNLYSGYLKLTNDTDSKQIHYVFAENPTNPKNAPVVLWLNGGPGCSSMDGFMYENGPFYFSFNSTTLNVNPYAWNSVANMLYFESPAGVGFSIAGNSGNLATNDWTTAVDNLTALQLFFKGFPEYLGNEFFISGESYAGIYVPTLAYQVLLNNNQTTSTKINLKGIMVGNGVTDWKVDADSATPQFAWERELIDDYTWTLWNENECNVLKQQAENSYCNTAAEIVNEQFTNINIYDIYRNCTNTPTTAGAKVAHPLKDPGNTVTIPCVDSYGADQYFNTLSVKQAFHVSQTITWNICSDQLQYTVDYQNGSLWVYEILKQNGIRALFYSGDTDASVPTTGSKKWIEGLGWDVVSPWRQWFITDDAQVSGYVVDYDGLTFVTIKGVGHMSIQWKRPQGYHVFTNFLNNQRI